MLVNSAVTYEQCQADARREKWQSVYWIMLVNSAVTYEQCQADARREKWQSVYWIMLVNSAVTNEQCQADGRREKWQSMYWIMLLNSAVTYEQCQADARREKWQSVYWIMLLCDLLYTVFFSSGLAHICWVGSNANCIILMNTAILTRPTDDYCPEIGLLFAQVHYRVKKQQQESEVFCLMKASKLDL